MGGKVSRAMPTGIARLTSTPAAKAEPMKGSGLRVKLG
jgi:hypothetical protein